MGTSDERTSYADRIDPNGELRRDVRGLQLLASRPFSWALRMLGVNSETLQAATELPDRLGEHLSNAERIPAALGPLGWILFGDAPADVYTQAAALVEAGDLSSADELIEQAWNQHDAMRLHRSVHGVRVLYRNRSVTDRRIGEQRATLIHEAVELHREGRYAAAVPLAFAQIDGIAHDMTGHPPRSFFTRKKNDHLTDNTTFAGHPLGLTQLSEFMSAQVKGTTTETPEHPLRNGVMHGRTLGYGTRRLSTMTLVALLATIEWAKPLAEEQDRAYAEEIDRRYLGTRERDEEGRLFDRRGFTDAIRLLNYARGQQRGFYERNSRFAATRDELDPRNAILDGEITITSNQEGDQWVAWAPTPTGFTFGVGQTSGDLMWHEYAGWRPPGPLGSDGWRYEGDLEAQPHRDFRP